MFKSDILQYNIKVIYYTMIYPSGSLYYSDILKRYVTAIY